MVTPTLPFPSDMPEVHHLRVRTLPAPLQVHHLSAHHLRVIWSASSKSASSKSGSSRSASPKSEHTFCTLAGARGGWRLRRLLLVRPPLRQLCLPVVPGPQPAGDAGGLRRFPQLPQDPGAHAGGADQGMSALLTALWLDLVSSLCWLLRLPPQDPHTGGADQSGGFNRGKRLSFC
eukprot:1162133-Pelagomonas_calceolata.AAC.8